MVRTPGLIIPSAYSSQEELESDLRRRDEAAGFTPFDASSFMHFGANKPPLDEDTLIHFGIKGMHWGVRKDDAPGVTRATNKEARKDAVEFARAKMFYGEGAGTRRKLIKASVEAKSKRNPDYKKAFEHHLAQQDLSTHADKARSERKRKDVKNTTMKNVRAINRSINGPFAGPVAAAAVLGAYGYMHKTGLDTKVVNAGKGFINTLRFGTKVDLGFLK
jgi:hypothetical protein